MSNKWTYAEKMRQANKEAKATVVALALTIVVWIVGGFGLSVFDVTIYHTPLWVIGGTLGTWVFSILVVLYLNNRVFKDYDLDEPAENEVGQANLSRNAQIPSQDGEQ